MNPHAEVQLRMIPLVVERVAFVPMGHYRAMEFV